MNVRSMDPMLDGMMLDGIERRTSWDALLWSLSSES